VCVHCGAAHVAALSSGTLPNVKPKRLIFVLCVGNLTVPDLTYFGDFGRVSKVRRLAWLVDIFLFSFSW
jgi:hypothetical protein